MKNSASRFAVAFLVLSLPFLVLSLPLLAGPAAAAPPAEASHRLGLLETLKAARQEFQVYRGDRLERVANRFAVGRSRFDPKRSVADNLKGLVEQQQLPHYFADINGRQVLHVVIDLAKGKQTSKALRAVLRQVGEQTIELNYKASSAKNPYGHVAVRLGGGALYDLTGTRGMAELPPTVSKLLNLVRGSSDLSLARRRSLRRFMESRTDTPDASASVFYGMLFAASPEQIKQTDQLYRKRQSQMTAFSVSGGDSSKGVYSCAQFLTEAVPFLNERGVAGNIGAKSTASAGRASSSLEAVVVYKMPSVQTSQLSFP